MSEKKIVLTLPKSKKSITVLRMTSAAVASGMNFSLEDIEDIKMCIAEAMILSIAEEIEGEDSASFFMEEDKLIINFGNFKEEPQKESMSMQIISSLMDKVSFDKGILTITKIRDN